MVLPTFVDLAESLGEAELLQKPDHRPRRVELAAERRELRRGRTGVVVVVQTLPEGDERKEPEVGSVVREALVAEGVARAVALLGSPR